MNFPTMMITLALVLLGLSAGLAQEAGFNHPCDPVAPDEPPQCNRTMHLVCLPFYNHITEGTCHCGAGTFWNPSPLDDCRAGAAMPCSTAVVDDGKPKCVQFASCQPVTGGGANEGICTCNENHYPLANGSYCVVGHQTLCATVLGQRAYCDSNKRLQCGGTDPINRYCVCSGANLWSESRGKCLSTVETSSSCNANDDCVDHALCIRPQFGIARCHCAPGFTKTKDNTCALALGATCDPAASAPVKCNEDQYLACSAANQTCACADERVLVNGACLGLAGHACAQHAHHECAGGNYCHVESLKCFCSLALGSIELADRTCGRLGRAGYCRLGGFDDCPGAEHLQCNPVAGTNYGRCECADGLSMDPATGRCFRLAGATCSEGIQNCVANAACLHGTCSCLPHSAQTSDGLCLKTFDQTCDLQDPDSMCFADQGLICGMDGSCICRSGQEWDQARKHCVALVSGSCSPSTNYCTTNANCSSLGFCECASGYAQRSTEDRRCAPSHGTACHPETAPCNEHQFLTCPTPLGGAQSQCACEFPLHQSWEPSRGQCVSVLGGRCGALDEHDGRELRCVETADCLLGPDLVSKCGCDEESGKVPDGQGKCMVKDDPTTTTTTTTTTSTPTPTPTPTPTTTTTPTPGDGNNGAPTFGGSGVRSLMLLSSFTLFISMIVIV